VFTLFFVPTVYSVVRGRLDRNVEIQQ
jgi:hypothetical protein